MKLLHTLTLSAALSAAFTAALLMPAGSLSADDNDHAGALGAMYNEVIRTVEVGDFDAMAATYTKDAILVTANSTMPISKAIAGWAEDGEKLAAAGSTATVAFRFSAHQHGESTAFDSGIFRYSVTDKEGTEKVFLAHFEDLLIKQDGVWLCVMERQVRQASQAEWDALK